MSSENLSKESFHSLKFEALVELVALLNHNNILAAAHSLGISQSTLSKHLAKLEETVGFQLFYHGYRLTFTPAGRRFALCSASILEHMKRNIQECSDRQAKELSTLHIDMHDVSFIGQEKLNKALAHFMLLNESYDYSLAPKNYTDSLEALQEDMIDLCVWSEFGDIQEIIRQQSAEGIGLIYLSSENLIAWATKTHRIFSLKTLAAVHIARERIMTPSSTELSNYRSVQDKLFKTESYSQFLYKKDLRLANTRAKFLMLDPGESIYLLPESYVHLPYVRERGSMQWRLIEDGTSLHHIFLAYKLESPNDCVLEFANYLRSELF